MFVVATVGNDDASKFQKTATIWVLSSGCYLIETASTINILFSIRVEIGLSNGIQYQSYIFS